MLELSLRLLPLGFSISFLLTEDSIPKVNRPNDEHFQIVSIPKPPKSFISSPEMQEPIEEVLLALQPKVKCIISDFFLGWTQDIANHLGVPRIAFATSNATTECMCYHIPQLIAGGYLPINADLEDKRLIDFLPGLEPLHRSRLPFSFLEDNPFMHTLGKALARMKEALCVLVNAVEELEQEVVDARRSEFIYLPVGPLIPREFLRHGSDALEHSEDVSPKQNDDDVRCLSWLDKQAPRSVLYIAFGSVVSVPAAKLEKLAQALKASEQCFLWAIRRDCIKDVDAADDLSWESLETRFGEQGLVVEWAAQGRILQHASVGGFLTHCGWNSTMEAVSAGVPTLCWPCDAEQNVNAHTMVEKWGIGMQIVEGPDSEVRVEEIERAIRGVLRGVEGREMRSRVERLGAVVGRAACSTKNLVRFSQMLK